MVIFREGDVQLELVASLVADNLLLKARDELAGAEVEREVFAFAALECNAVLEAFKVNQSGVAVLGSSFNVGQTGVSLSHSFQLGVDVGSHDGLDGLFCLDALVVLNGYVRFYSDGRFEVEAVALLDLQVGDVRAVNRLDARFFYSGLVSCRVNHVDGVVIEELFAIHLLDHRLWRFALAEARQSDGLYLLFIRLHQSVLELLLAYLYQQFHRVVLKFVYRSQTHVVSIPFFILCRIG